MEDILHNNRDIIAATYRSCYDDLKRYIGSYTHDVMAAEDMIQDLFLKMMSLDVVAESTARSLAFIMAKRMIVDDVRHKSFVRQQERHISQTASMFDSVTPMSAVVCHEIARAEDTILDNMAPKRARVYRMYHHDELTAQEIADKTGLSKRTVETHIYLSTKQMRERMRKAL